MFRHPHENGDPSLSSRVSRRGNPLWLPIIGQAQGPAPTINWVIAMTESKDGSLPSQG